jgi:hypothetical protein
LFVFQMFRAGLVLKERREGGRKVGVDGADEM